MNPYDFPSIPTMTDEQVGDCLEGAQDGSITDVTIISLIVNLRRSRSEATRLTRLAGWLREMVRDSYHEGLEFGKSLGIRGSYIPSVDPWLRSEARAAIAIPATDTEGAA